MGCLEDNGSDGPVMVSESMAETTFSTARYTKVLEIGHHD